MRFGSAYVSAITLLLGAGCVLGPEPNASEGAADEGTLSDDPATARSELNINQTEKSPWTVGAPAGRTGLPIYVRSIQVCGASFRTHLANLAPTPLLGAVVAITFDGTARAGRFARVSNGSSDVLLAKYSALGTPQWVRTFGDAAEQAAGDVATDPWGYLYLFGSFAGVLDFGRGISLTAHTDQSEAFLAKLDPYGNAIWARQFAAEDGYVLASRMAIHARGRIAIAGSIDGWPRFGGLPPDRYVNGNYLAELDSDGNVLWTTTFRGADQSVTAVSFDEQQNVAVTEDHSVGARTYILRWDASGTLLLDRQYEYGTRLEEDSFDMISGPAGNLYALGEGYLGGAGNRDDGLFYLSKFNTAGDVVWIRRFSSDRYTRIAFSRFGHLHVVGLDVTEWYPSPTNRPVVMASYDTSGNRIWTRRLGTAASVDALETDSLGASLLGGTVHVDPPAAPLLEGTPGSLAEEAGPMPDHGGAAGFDRWNAPIARGVPCPPAGDAGDVQGVHFFIAKLAP